MNKPIRVVSVFCLVLFMALLVNATYLMYVRADDLGKDPRNRRIITATFSRERGAILVGKDAIARSVPSDDKYKFQRTYSEPFKYAPITGYFSWYSQTGVERSQNSVLAGDDSRLFVTRLVDLLSNTDPKGGNVQLTVNAAAQDAAWDGLEALPGDAQGAVVALEPTTGRILAMASTPTFDPNGFASHDFGAVDDLGERLNADEREPLINRAIGTTLPPGSTFKLVTAAAAIESGNYDADSMVPGGFRFQLPQSSDHHRQLRRRQLRRPPDHPDPGPAGLLQRHLPHPGQRAGQRRDGRAGRGLRLQLHLARGPRRPGPVALPARHGRPADRDVGHRPVERHRDAAADGDGRRRDRQRRRRDAPLRRRRGPRPQPLGPRPHRPAEHQQGDLEHDRRGAHQDARRHRRRRHRLARPRSRASRSPARPAPRSPPATGRPTPGSSPSPPPTTRRSRSPCSCSPATPRPTRSAAACSAARSPRRSWRR